MSCVNGHLSVAKWIYNRFQLTAEDIQLLRSIEPHSDVSKWVAECLKL
jgi:hypothetical protein